MASTGIRSDFVILLLLCAAILLFNIWAGYRTGGLAQIGALVALFASFAVSSAIVTAHATFASLSFIPALLQPYVLATAAGTLIYVILSFLWNRAMYRMDAGLYLRRQQEIQALSSSGVPDEQLPPVGNLRPVTNSAANRTFGIVFGTVKGGLICGVVLVIAYVVGSIAQATQAALHPRPGHAPVGSGGMFLSQLRHTPVGALAESVTPIKSKQVELIGKLQGLSEHPKAAKRFGSDPRIRELEKNPSVQKLMHDPRIVKEVEQQRWADLMNEPSIVNLIHDPDLRRQVEEIDFEKILGESLRERQ